MATSHPQAGLADDIIEPIASEVYQQECNQDIIWALDAHDVKVMHMGYVCEGYRQEPPGQHAQKVLRQEIRGRHEGARQEGPTCQETYML